VRKLAARSDIVIENFKTGGLAKFGLDYNSLVKEKPDIIYCSVTGFGQDGPYAHRAGYDLLVQGMGGIMDLTGLPDGEPMRGGVAFADVMTGIYSAVAITAALNERNATGKGSYIDMALLDTRCRARQPGLELSGQRQGAQAHGQCASRGGAVSGVSGGRRPRHHRLRQRHPVRRG
jgi:crotonobetainyl-CoA:carnitine CoA-transferase CaiB-like acyl-CoA transferase